METIVAQASARGRAGVAVIRVSGPEAWGVCERLAGGVPVPRAATLRRLRDAQGATLDHALVLAFEEGRSFTGEQVVEFHLHGSVAVVAVVLREILGIDGVRPAEPGEFTRRAFEAGRIDLTEVEGLGDLLEAETEAQRKHAQRIMEGSIARLVDNWRADLVQALAMSEAAIDFADEDLPPDTWQLMRAPLDRVCGALQREVSGRRAAERVRDGFEVAIVGAVNAGKSTLLNALAGRDAAITSERAGTTRDVIEVRMEIGGLAVTLIDTAGLRDTEDEVELLGIARGKARAREADLRVFLKSDPDEVIADAAPEDIVLLGKADLWPQSGVSGKTGEGIDTLIGWIEDRLAMRASSSSSFSRERHFARLQAALEHLERARQEAGAESAQLEIVSEEIRHAVFLLDELVGRIGVEEVLGRIFSSFCIGK
jgi:tRNA modification GTPase